MSITLNLTSRRLEIDQLEDSIIRHCHRINAATYDLLVDLREFDQRAGFLRCGFDNCADWLHWRCDISLSAAREKLRVAHALLSLPLISTSFGEGLLAYSKVRALTRVVHRDNDLELLAFALEHTATQVEQRCQELRCGTPESTEQAQRAYSRRSLSTFRNPEKGTITYTLEVPIEQGEMVDKALDKANALSHSDHAEFAKESWSAQRADAFLKIANVYLSGKQVAEGAVSDSDNYLITVHVDQAVLAEGKGRSGLPVESVKRLCCDGNTITIVENANGEPLSIGRKSRTVPTAIKRALHARDKHCRFPGCRNSRFVDAHHIQHWSAGGETSLGNLLLLCGKHHRLIHEGGFRIVRDYQDQWIFTRPDGIAVPACGYRKADTLDTIAVELSTMVNHPSREGLLSKTEKINVSSLQMQAYQNRKFLHQMTTTGILTVVELPFSSARKGIKQ
jgi:hypothetical protein